MREQIKCDLMRELARIIGMLIGDNNTAMQAGFDIQMPDMKEGCASPNKTGVF